MRLTTALKLFPFSLASLLLAGISGCDMAPATLEDNFDDAIAWTTSGCGDAYVYSHDADDTVAIFFHSTGQVQEAYEAGEVRTFTLTLGTDATLEVQQGEKLTKEICNDVIEMNDRPVVERTYTAISGTATLVITPGDDVYQSSGTLSLEDVVLSASDDPELLIESYGPVSATLGWLPG